MTRGLGVGVLPLNDRINLFFSILVTFILIQCWDSILIFYGHSKNIMFYTEPWWVFFILNSFFMCYNNWAI